MSTGATGQAGKHPRGVFSAQWRSPSGDEVLLAVDSCGRVLATANVTDSAKRQPATDQLRTLLNLLDPLSGSLHVVE